MAAVSAAERRVRVGQPPRDPEAGHQAETGLSR